MFKKKEKKIKNPTKQKEAPKVKTLIDAMPIGVCVIDLNGMVIEANETSHKMFGVEKDEAIGKTCTHYIAEEDGPKALKAIQECISKGYYRGFETIGIRKDGSKFSLLVDGTLTKDAQGNPSNIVLMYRDISELKRAEEKRIEAEKKATRPEEAEKYPTPKSLRKESEILRDFRR